MKQNETIMLIAFRADCALEISMLHISNDGTQGVGTGDRGSVL